MHSLRAFRSDGDEAGVAAEF